MGYDQISATLAPSTPALRPLQAGQGAEGGHPALGIVANWAENYLSQPHPDLGRNGPMCPFVPAAMSNRLLFAAVYEQTDLDVEAIKAILLYEIVRFIELEPVSGNQAQWKSVLVLFPNLPPEQAERMIEQAQPELQPFFVPNGLMVGEFHAGPPRKRGLWNPDFRPLYSPVPMLVIRHMVPTDVLFLKDDAALFAAYAKIYGNAVPERFGPYFEEAAKRFGISMNPARAEPLEAAPRVIEALDAAGVRYRVHCHDDHERPIRKPRDFAEALGYDEGRITKTLFMKNRDDGSCFLVVCGMDRQVDLKKLAGFAGARRLEMASLTDLQRHIGYPPTSVTPIAVAGVPVYLDEALLTLPTVLTGSGVPRVEIELAPKDLCRLAKARVTALSRD